MDSEQPNLVLQRFAQAIVQRPRVESKFPAGLLVVPEIRHPREISESLGPRQGDDGAEEAGGSVEPGRWDSGDPLGHVERIDHRVGRSRDMYASPALPRSIARMRAPYPRRGPSNTRSVSGWLEACPGGTARTWAGFRSCRRDRS